MAALSANAWGCLDSMVGLPRQHVYFHLRPAKGRSALCSACHHSLMDEQCFLLRYRSASLRSLVHVLRVPAAGLGHGEQPDGESQVDALGCCSFYAGNVLCPRLCALFPFSVSLGRSCPLCTPAKARLSIVERVLLPTLAMVFYIPAISDIQTHPFPQGISSIGLLSAFCMARSTVLGR